MSKKHLWLIRHAKATAHRGVDHDRELSKRGFRQCAEMGNYLKRTSHPPDVFLSSTARRAATTAYELSAYVDGTLHEEPSLYTFNVDHLLTAFYSALMSQDLAAVRCVALVGHNGAISDLVSELTKGRNYLNLPTLGMAHLSSDTEWGEILDGEWTLVERVVPLEKKRP